MHLVRIVEPATKIPGWFEAEELFVLGSMAAAVVAGDVKGEIVEVGCHRGMATAVLAGVAAELAPSGRAHVIDPFDGVTGGIGEGLWTTDATRDDLIRTIGELGLQSALQCWQGTASGVDFDLPISFLLINGLHDYGSVASDFSALAPQFADHAVVAFHNYGTGWHGVQAFVDDLVGSGEWRWVTRVSSLAVLGRAARPLPQPRSPRRWAFLTMVANEAVFLPIWLDYYSRFADPSDIYVIDHDSTDGSTTGSGFVRLPVHNPMTDWSWMTEVVRQQQRRLLERYDIVVYGDVDEIVAPDPAYGDLTRYLERLDSDFVTCRGWEVLHDPDTEPAYDPERPVLDQRGWWFPNPAYSKPAVATTPVPWTGGFHGRADGLVNDDPRLFVVHLHRMDYDICRARHEQRVARPWVDAQVQGGWGYQDRIVDAEPFKHWFFHDPSCPGVTVHRQQIPPRWRGPF